MNVYILYSIFSNTKLFITRKIKMLENKIKILLSAKSRNESSSCQKCRGYY